MIETIEFKIVHHQEYADMIIWCYQTFGPSVLTRDHLNEDKVWTSGCQPDHTFDNGRHCIFAFYRSNDALQFKLTWL
jgi:hypothetical protein